MDISSDSFSYKCYLCNRIFAQNHLLKTHLIQCRKASYVCETCGKRFVQKSGYKSHLRSHENMKNVIYCDYCKKKFKEKHNLMVHINYYHPEKVPKKPAPKKARHSIETTFSSTGRALFHSPAPIPFADDRAEDVEEESSDPTNDSIPRYEPATFPIRNKDFKEDVLPDIADYFRDE